MAVRRAGARAKGVSLDLRGDPPIMALVDPARFSQVVGNLLFNASEHTLEGGSVSVEVSGAAGQVIVAVDDTGPGIDPEHLPCVFDRLGRADAAREASAGRGLGLAIARGLAQALGGDVTAGNRSEGGATFVVTVPIVSDPTLAD